MRERERERERERAALLGTIHNGGSRPACHPKRRESAGGTAGEDCVGAWLGRGGEV